MDPCVVAYLLAPELFSGHCVNIAIEHRSELTMGMTVIDLLGVSGRAPNAQWIDGVDSAGVLALLERALSTN
ncbi:nucleoside hydrolase [Bosea sp. NPDC003192]|uniref:nucleoside hydrolase n=1 Tax=Bosea sp. NPDC003192 TaxID=3390551 RepID=UPI003CFD74F8